MAEYDVTPPPVRLIERVQLRTAFSTDRGTVTAFLVQLEYWRRDDWDPVVRYDHDREAAGGHDVTEEGLHRDVFRGGQKDRTVQVTGPIPANRGFDYAEDDLRGNLEGYVSRYERWHDIRNGPSP